jgi:hypothetical protein
MTMEDINKMVCDHENRLSDLEGHRYKSDEPLDYYECPIDVDHVFAINDQKRTLLLVTRELRRIHSRIASFPLHLLSFDNPETRNDVYDMIDSWFDGAHHQLKNLKTIMKIAYNDAREKDKP